MRLDAAVEQILDLCRREIIATKAGDGQDAALLVNETFLGASQLLEASGKSPEALRKQVTSPNGTTERAIARMGQTDLEAMFVEATDAALARARELAAGK